MGRPACLALAFALAGPAIAQTPEEFYRGKTISVAVYGDAGSSYDVYARALARHMPDFIPGKPAMIVRNIPGAGGLTATRYLYSTAPKDGTVFGTITRGIPFDPLFGSSAVQFDPLQFVWLGSMSKETTMYVSWHTSAVKTAQDLMTKDLLLAGTGAGADSEVISHALNGLLGTRIKLISGYQGAAQAALSLERGEIEGLYWTWNGINTVQPTWISGGKLNLLFQTRATPHPELPHVPLVTVLAKTDEDRQALSVLFARDILGRPFFAPPGTPADRVEALRKAFYDAVKSPGLIEEAGRLKMELELVTGPEVAEVVRGAYAAPAGVVERIRKVMARP